MAKFINYILCLSLLFTSCCSLTSCSAVLAVSKPDKKDVSVFNAGKNRNDILKELGPPDISLVNQDGNLVESWTFKQGESKLGKTGRAVFHLAADFFTLFLWEMIGTPAEIITEKNSKTYVVTFDKDENIQNIDVTENN